MLLTFKDLYNMMTNEKKGKTFAGKLIRSVLGAADTVLTGGKLRTVLNVITGSDELTNEQKDQALEEVQLYLSETQDARANETARDVSQYSSFLSKNIHEMIAIIVIGGWMVTWFVKVEIPQIQITGAVMLILGYLYGKSQPEKS